MLKTKGDQSQLCLAPSHTQATGKKTFVFKATEDALCIVTAAIKQNMTFRGNSAPCLSKPGCKEPFCLSGKSF